jgi:hypothetical protein
MSNEQTFKTKTGFCHILSDKIVLTRDEIIGDIAKVIAENKIPRILIIYAGISIGLFYFTFDSYKNGQITLTLFFGILGIYLIYGIINSINNSATPIIDRNKIKAVKFRPAISGLTRSRFEVFFETENGKIKKRLIMLPGSLSGGQNETEKALKIMKDEKLITND